MVGGRLIGGNPEGTGQNLSGRNVKAGPFVFLQPPTQTPFKP